MFYNFHCISPALLLFNSFLNILLFLLLLLVELLSQSYFRFAHCYFIEFRIDFYLLILNLFISSNGILLNSLGTLFTRLHPVWLEIVSLLLFQSWCLLFFLSIWLQFPVQCWMAVVKVDILFLSYILEGNNPVFHQ